MRTNRTSFPKTVGTVVLSTLVTAAGLFGSASQLSPTTNHHSAAHGSLSSTRVVSWSEAARSTVSYAGHVENLERWNHFPLTVAFRHDGNYTAQRQAAILAGFRQWSGATRGVVAFTLTNDLRGADVTVSCDPTRVISQTDTDYNPDDHVLSHATIVMGVESPDGPYQPVTPAELQGLAAHEFGHALGINGHSDSSKDLMYPSLGEDNRSVTLRDLNTLKIAYRPAGSRTVSQ